MVKKDEPKKQGIELPDSMASIHQEGQSSDIDSKEFTSKGSNKIWKVKQWKDVPNPQNGHEFYTQVIFGRINSKLTEERTWRTEAYVTETIAQKKKGKKGSNGQHSVYEFMDLLKTSTIKPASLSITTPTLAQIIQIDPKVKWLVDWMSNTTKTSVDTWLDATIDMMSKAQIQKGRERLMRVNDYVSIVSGRVILPKSMNEREGLVKAINNYMKAIPTRMEGKTAEERINNFLDGLLDGRYEDQLNQLEIQVDQYIAQESQAQQQKQDTSQPKVDPSSVLLQVIGADIERLPEGSQAYENIVKYLDVDYSWKGVGSRKYTSNGLGKKVDSIFLVENKAVNANWMMNTVGKSNVMWLWHGTYNPNVQPITAQGLRVPRSKTNGWRLGPGIYLGDAALRSFEYTRPQHTRGTRIDNHPDQYTTLFLVETAIGKFKTYTGDASSLRTAPAGFDSTYGTNSFANRDEFVVYNENQHRLRALVVIKNW